LNAHPFFSRHKVVILLAGFCCLLWGSAYPAIKNGYALFAIAQDDIASKMVFAGYRFVCAGLLLLILAALTQRKLFNLTWMQLRQIGLLGLTQTSLQYVFFYIGLAYTTGVKGSIMNATGTFFSVLLAHFIYKNDRLSINKIVGCIVGFAGVMVVNFSQDLLDFHFTLAGEGCVMMAAFILSAASIYGKKVSQDMDSLIMTGYQLAFGGWVLVVGGYMAGGTLTGFTVASAALLFYLALMSSVAFALWSLLLKYNRVGMVTIFNFLVPIFGAILSAVFLRENILEWKNVIALALVCLGIWMVTRQRLAGQ
jgi:drug/metabolite transporter (DMT)-like permease